MRLLAALSASIWLAGCASAVGSSSSGSSIVGTHYLRVFPGTALSYEALLHSAIAVGAIYLVYDPLAPNWEIEETRLAEDSFRLSLRMKRYQTGGGGESMQILRRRVEALQRDKGYGSYQLVDFSEGIESETLGARRVASGIVRLTQPALAKVAASAPLQAAPVTVPTVTAVKAPECANSFLIDPC